MIVLPLDVVERISEFCEDSDFISMTAVCKDWHEAVREEALKKWRAHIHAKFPVIRGLFGEKFEETFKSPPRSVQILTLSKGGRVFALFQDIVVINIKINMISLDPDQDLQKPHKVTEEWTFTMKDKEMKVQRKWDRKYEWQATRFSDNTSGDQLCAGYEDYFHRLIRREPCGSIGLDFEGPRTIRVTNALGLQADVSTICLE